jgi:hypothetical protein
MKTWGSGGMAPLFLTWALDGAEWSVSRLGRFYPWESAAGTQCTGGCLGLRASLDTAEKCIILDRAGNRIRTV